MTTTSAEKPFITCHVLDTISGKPAAKVNVKLKLVWPDNEQQAQWTAQTNDDGRVTAWQGTTELNKVVADAKFLLREGEALTWSLIFDTEGYFGKGKTFWQEVDLKFIAQPTEKHYHVPLLLGPWSYTTYRGS